MGRIAVVNSNDAPGELCPSEFSKCLVQLANLMNVLDKPIPQILLLHVSDAVAASFGVNSPGAIRHNRTDGPDPHDYYEVWVVGAPDICSYVLAVLAILEDCFTLDISIQERQNALRSVLRSRDGYAVETIQ
jgi:hypothetical protein